MPKPVFKINDINEILLSNINLLDKFDKNIKISFLNKTSKSKININCDYEQISRVFFNLIKNSIESIQEKANKYSDFSKIINIEIFDLKEYITINIIDFGNGFPDTNEKNLIKPYYTTKQKGSGLGLSIVNKIINDHNGTIKLSNHKNGAMVEIKLPNK